MGAEGGPAVWLTIIRHGHVDDVGALPADWQGAQITGVGPSAQAITVRHLLSMASGHTIDTINALDRTDPVGSFLRIEPDQEPGSVFCYNQGCTITLSAIVQRVTGQPLHEYLRPRLFDPLGVGEIEWLPIGREARAF